MSSRTSSTGPTGDTGPTGEPGQRGRRGLRGRKGERGPAQPVTTHHLDHLHDSFRRVVLVVEGFSVVVTVALVITLLGLANQGDEDLAHEINENANVTRRTASATQVELTQHHYFDSCVFLVLTAGGVERTPQEARDVIRRCSRESDSLREAAPVDDVLERNYPSLFK